MTEVLTLSFSCCRFLADFVPYENFYRITLIPNNYLVTISIATAFLNPVCVGV
jgi:hypothetical protein